MQLESGLLTFGQRIRELRHGKRLSQLQLADQVRIDVTYLSKIENGRVAPPAAHVIERMARSLGVEADELVLLAKRVPRGYAEQIQNDPLVADFLRTASKLKESQRQQIKRILHENERG